MAEKYTILYSKAREAFCVIKEMEFPIADFLEEEDAQEYCNWKNAEGIDKNIKQLLQQFLKERLGTLKLRVSLLSKAYYKESKLKLESAIEIISKLKEAE